MFEQNVPKQFLAVIKVIGVGGGGNNAVNRMIEAGLQGVDFIGINTDTQALQGCMADIRLPIGNELTKGLGAGNDPGVGERAAESSSSEIKDAIQGADLVFVTAGKGGGTGTGAAPVVAQIAKSCGALTIAVVTTPFSFEGKRRLDMAMNGVKRLKPDVDNLIIVHNDRLLQYVEHNAPIEKAFATADEVVTEGILSVSQLVNVPGEINVDLADVKAVMGIPGTALMAIGSGDGQRAASEAAEQAIANPLLDLNMTGAKGVLFNYAGGPGLTLGEVNDSANLIAREADPKALIFFGMMAPNPELEGKVRMTVIATGIKAPFNEGWFAGSGLPYRESFGGRR